MLQQPQSQVLLTFFSILVSFLSLLFGIYSHWQEEKRKRAKHDGSDYSSSAKNIRVVNHLSTSSNVGRAYTIESYRSNLQPPFTLYYTHLVVPASKNMGEEIVINAMLDLTKDKKQWLFTSSLVLVTGNCTRKNVKAYFKELEDKSLFISFKPLEETEPYDIYIQTQVYESA